MYFRHITVTAFVAIISACSAMTTISSPRAGTMLALKDTTASLPLSQNMKGTSFGNYEFKAVDAGSEPLYGTLPLRFKGRHLAADIILFPPAAFFNLRDVFPYYEVDVSQGVIRYKKTPSEGWTEYKPKPEEAARARTFFETKPSGATAAAGAAQ
jgi:hypothetical protein